jgi:HlyD family secretion protein
MKRRAKFVVPVLVVVLGIGAWWWWSGRGGADGLESSGTVEATEADLGFQIPGRLSRILPREGDAIREGDLLAALDSSQLAAARSESAARIVAAEARLRELRSGSRVEEIRSAEAALTATREREEEARRDAERSRRLFDGGAISRQALDRAETQLRVASAEADRALQAVELAREGPRSELIDAQEAVVEQARAGLARAEAAYDDALLAAPFDGIVTVRHREPGEIVPAGAPILTLLDPEDRWVRIYVPEDRIGAVSLGQRASIRSDTYPDRTYDGEVVFIGSEAEFTPRNVQTPEERTRLVYPVKVRITGDPDFELKPGIPADVSLGSGAGT